MVSTTHRLPRTNGGSRWFGWVVGAGDDDLVAAAVVLPCGYDTTGLIDSKKLSEKKRNALGQKLRNEVLSTSKKDFRKFGDILNKAFKDPNILVLCDNESANEANLRKLTNIF